MLILSILTALFSIIIVIYLLTEFFMVILSLIVFTAMAFIASKMAFSLWLKAEPKDRHDAKISESVDLD